MIENAPVIVKNELSTNTNVLSAEAIVLLVNVPKLEVKIPTTEATAPTSAISHVQAKTSVSNREKIIVESESVRHSSRPRSSPFTPCKITYHFLDY